MFILKPVLHRFDPEFIHDKTLDVCAAAQKIPGLVKLIGSCFAYDAPELETSIGNLTFPNPVGLAAGFDKNGEAVQIMEALGFGFIEIGAVTPLPQPGNPKPRIFRLKADRAIINRMGFNNKGLKKLAASGLTKYKRKIPMGINLGKNKNTPLNLAADDYVKGMAGTWALADYFTINVSSPNTKNLRDLQRENALRPFVKEIIDFRNRMAEEKGELKQVWLKIAPDLGDEELKVIAEVSLDLQIDALVVSNTTLSRKGLKDKQSFEEGGLSGEPLFNLSNLILKKTRDFTENKLPLIGAGGVFSAEDALEKFRLGASLVQIYTALVYEGPGAVKKIKKGLAEKIALNKKILLNNQPLIETQESRHV